MCVVMDLLGQMGGNWGNEGRERVQNLPRFVRMYRSTSLLPQTFSSTVTTDLRSILPGVLAYSVSLVMSKYSDESVVLAKLLNAVTTGAE